MRSATAKFFFFKRISSTLPVKTCSKERGMFVLWSVDCYLCKTPESIDQVFAGCWDAVLFREMLKRTVKNDLHITLYSICFGPVPKGAVLPYDLLIVLGLYSLWKSRMGIRHADVSPFPAHV